MTSIDPISQFRVDGKIAIVTGASSGLGARFARVLHAAGATVVLTARRIDRLESLSKELPGSISIKCDVASASDREALIAEVISQCGRVDILVNNAGITHKIRQLSRRTMPRVRALSLRYRERLLFSGLEKAYV